MIRSAKRLRSIGNSNLIEVSSHSRPWVNRLKRIRETSPVAIFGESDWKQRLYCTIALFQMHPSKSSGTYGMSV
jgi:hypothetical protein